MELLRAHGIDPAGRRVTVVGRSLVIGRPAALLLTRADATVTLCHRKTPDLAARCRAADILLAAAGARNVMDDLPRSWTQVSWESVVARDPQVIVIVDYSAVTAAQKQQFLLSQPALARVAAIRDRRFVVIPYDAATPGPENVAAVETLARALYPAAFAGPAR